MNKITDEERNEIKYYYDRLEKGTKSSIAFLPFIMKAMGQYLSLSEEFEIQKLAQNKEASDLDDLIKIANNYWKDVKSIEKAIQDLDLFNTGIIKRDFLDRILNQYGEPLNEKDLKSLIKYLFKQNDEISCKDAIKLLLDSKKPKKKTKNKLIKKRKTGVNRANIKNLNNRI
jgi:Ca2+-binding EF-hand superfamily protein